MERDAILAKITELQKQHLDSVIAARALEGAIQMLQAVIADIDKAVQPPVIVKP